jgi:hypothetical protein
MYTPFESDDTLIQICDIALKMNFSRDTRLDIVMDVLDQEIYFAESPKTLPSGSKQYCVPRTGVAFKRLFSAQRFVNALACDALRELKDRIRERGYSTIGFTYDGQWIVVVS